ATVAPASRKARVIARPMQLPPPVTRTTEPVKSNDAVATDGSSPTSSSSRTTSLPHRDGRWWGRLPLRGAQVPRRTQTEGPAVRDRAPFVAPGPGAVGRAPAARRLV